MLHHYIFGFHIYDFFIYSTLCCASKECEMARTHNTHGSLKCYLHVPDRTGARTGARLRLSLEGELLRRGERLRRMPHIFPSTYCSGIYLDYAKTHWL